MIRADVDNSFFRRYLWIALGSVSYAFWCLYDGLIAYPRKLEIAKAFEAIPDDAMKFQAWSQLATENGWATRFPAKTAKEIEGMIPGQFMFAIICGVIGLAALIIWLRAKGSWVEGDETLIRNSRGKQVPIESITKIDKRKWPEKGIAKLHFKTDGRSGKFVLDDFQYDSAKVVQLLTFAEANLDASQIRGDQLEREKKSTADEDQESQQDSPLGQPDNKSEIEPEGSRVTP